MTSGREHGTSLRSALGISLAVGLGWVLLELAFSALRSPFFDLGEILRRLARLLPFYLVLFALLALVLAAATGRSGARPRTLGWLALGGVTLIFLAPRIGLGAYRTGSAGTAVVAVLVTSGVVALALGGLAALGRVLPRHLGRVWAFAAWTGWSLFWVPFLRRAGPVLALGRPGEEGWSSVVDTDEIVGAALGAALILALGALRRPRAAAVGALVGCTLVPAAAGGAEPRRPDVLIILVDTLRADELRAAGGTPSLDALAAESFHFTRAYAASNNTTRSMPAVFTSLSHNVLGAGIPADVETVTEILQGAGWATHGISANPWVSAQYGYHQGFDVLYDAANAPHFLVSPLLQILGALAPGPSYHAGIVGADLYYRPASELRRRAVEILRRHPSPLLLYVHTMDVHGPYLPPRRFLDADYRKEDFLPHFRFNRLDHDPRLETEEFRGYIRNVRQRYRGEIRYSDGELGKLIQAYRDAGRWDETLVWFLSDHGEAFGEHGYTGHAQSLFEPLVRIPVFMKPPRSAKLDPRQVQTPMSGFDVLPTTASLLGLPVPESAFGDDLTPILRGEDAVSSRTVIASGGRGYAAVRWPWKLHLDSKAPPGEQRQLYHLERDPDEQEDVALSHPGVVEALVEAIQERIRRERELGVRDAAGQVDPHIRQQLESLGYVE